MSHLTRKQRLIIAFGGFLFSIGLIILAVVILAAAKIIDIENLAQFKLLREVLVFVSILDIIAGFLLLRFSSR